MSPPFDSGQRKSRREREPKPRGRRVPSAGAMVRILFPPAQSRQRTRFSRRRVRGLPSGGSVDPSLTRSIASSNRGLNSPRLAPKSTVAVPSWLGALIAKPHLDGRRTAREQSPCKTAPEQCARLQEAIMLISDVLQTKGRNVLRIHTADSVEVAVRKLAEHRIGALVVEDRWMKPVGIFSERDFINAMARDGAAVLGFERSSTAAMNFLAMSPSIRRSRFLVNTDPSQISSSSDSPTNQRNNRLYCSCSISCVSERIE